MIVHFEAGELDIAFKSLNPSDIADLEKKPEYNTFKMSGPYIRYICFETSESVFQDKRLRQAIGALVDRPDMAQKVFLNQVEHLYSMVPNGMIYHQDSFKTAFGDGNVNKANALLAEAGYTQSNPLEFELWYTPAHYGSTEMDLAEVIAPAATKKIIGIRPGEKLHEILITEEEARHTRDCGNYFIITPEHKFWDTNKIRIGKKLPDRFKYSSDINNEWCTKEEIKNFVEGAEVKNDLLVVET